MDRFYLAFRALILLAVIASGSTQQACRVVSHGEDKVDWCTVQGEHFFFKSGSWLIAEQDFIYPKPSFTRSIEQAIA